MITPSLWNQEIIDALLVQEYPIFNQSFQKYTSANPVSRFNQKQSSSLSTAGFPNAIAALVPGKEAASALAKKLAFHLKDEWKTIAHKVRSDIKPQVMEFLKNPNNRDAIAVDTNTYPESCLRRDLEKCQTWVLGVEPTLGCPDRQNLGELLLCCAIGQPRTKTGDYQRRAR